jgi:hypothetical protein
MAALHVDRVVVAEAVEFIGRHAGLDEWLDVVEKFRRETPGDAHFFDFIWRLDGNAHGGELNGWGGARIKEGSHSQSAMPAVA